MFNITLIFTFILIPAKITSFLTFRDITWGTRGTNINGKLSWLKKYSILLLWFLIIINGLILSVFNNRNSFMIEIRLGLLLMVIIHHYLLLKLILTESLKLIIIGRELILKI